ncbi:uncharacterized protein LOC121864502 [Homarus americanus]|uniref:uncharacterized protein LOC121864502 n=1 Tax=Homarus americanus TaxID=6706 RepID=UPI001C462AD7|nr:uncharacterized protein LOC121864502 [Homarus americanus]
MEEDFGYVKVWHGPGPIRDLLQPSKNGGDFQQHWEPLTPRQKEWDTRLVRPESSLYDINDKYMDVNNVSVDPNEGYVDYYGAYVDDNCGETNGLRYSPVVDVHLARYGERDRQVEREFNTDTASGELQNHNKVFVHTNGENYRYGELPGHQRWGDNFSHERPLGKHQEPSYSPLVRRRSSVVFEDQQGQLITQKQPRKFGQQHQQDQLPTRYAWENWKVYNPSQDVRESTKLHYERGRPRSPRRAHDESSSAHPWYNFATPEGDPHRVTTAVREPQETRQDQSSSTDQSRTQNGNSRFKREQWVDQRRSKSLDPNRADRHKPEFVEDRRNHHERSESTEPHRLDLHMSKFIEDCRNHQGVLEPTKPHRTENKHSKPRKHGKGQQRRSEPKENRRWNQQERSEPKMPYIPQPDYTWYRKKVWK